MSDHARLPRMALICALVFAPCAQAHPPPRRAAEPRLKQPPAPITAHTSPDLAVARAKGILPSARTIEIVARLAEPVRLTRAEQSGAAKLSAAQVIAQLCGSVRPEYVKALKSENRLEALDLAAPLGDTAFSLAFPACLYAEENIAGVKNYTVLPNDTPTGILRLFTGAWAKGKRERAYIAESFGRRVSDTSLPLGERIAVPFSTRPTLLLARASSPVSFATSLEVELGIDVAVDEIEPGGEIIGAAKLAKGGAIAAGDEFPDCMNNDRPGYPFSAAAVASAYRASRDLLINDLGYPQQMVRLVIVDNGFFGVPCPDASNCPEMIAGKLQFSPRFPKRNFDADKFPLGALGPVSSNRIKAINYLNGLVSADAVSGHGTHVAGLALGGPLFENQREVFDFGGASWLKLVIANLAAGQKTFPVGVDEQIFQAVAKIDGPKIVNLSLTINGTIRPAVAGVMRQTITNDKATGLFIAAAGNDGKNLSGKALYPAGFGGSDDSLPNVITVASVDSDGQLSKFSNWGGGVADMAAPGCKISSWIDASHPEMRESGTSQSAPLVAFTAAMLRSIWDRSPAMLKSRTLYSGALIADPIQRARVASGVQLDMVAALLVRHDIVTYELPDPKTGEKPARVTLVGTLRTPLKGYSCKNGTEIPSEPGKIRSFKREGGDAMLFWRLADNGKNVICPAELQTKFGDVANEVAFHATYRLDPGGLTPIASDEPIPADRVTSIVYLEPGASKF
ncbi:S8/S53 family peptidase [Sphingomonas sp. PB2P19]|uniref:S8/S53 family peptidase n=1 Tax=Sphingomonas rhamnosi TaxID=3096156 RepID=UPI002FC6DB8A